MGKFVDDFVIIVTVALSLAIALFLSYSLVERGANYPPTLITLFLGIVVAALTFRFLGGAQQTEFKIGLLKLGGSAALLLGTTFVIGERIREEMNIFSTSQGYRDRIKNLTAETNVLGQEVAKKDKDLNAALAKIESMPAANVSATVESIAKMSPADPIIKRIRKMMEAQEGPFRQTIREVQLRVALAEMPNDAPLYSICQDSYDQLYDGVEPNSHILVSRSVGLEGVDTSVTVDRRGRIGSDICQSPRRDFDIQIGCYTALKLFADTIKTCADGPKIRGQKITVGALP